MITVTIDITGNAKCAQNGIVGIGKSKLAYNDVKVIEFATVFVSITFTLFLSLTTPDLQVLIYTYEVCLYRVYTLFLMVCIIYILLMSFMVQLHNHSMLIMNDLSIRMRLYIHAILASLSPM